MVSWWQTQPDQNFLSQFFHFSASLVLLLPLLLCFYRSDIRWKSLGALLSQAWAGAGNGLRLQASFPLSESRRRRRRRRENRLIFLLLLLLLLPLAISQMGFHTLPWRNSGQLGPLCWKWLTWPTCCCSPLPPPLPLPLLRLINY